MTDIEGEEMFCYFKEDGGEQGSGACVGKPHPLFGKKDVDRGNGQEHKDKGDDKPYKNAGDPAHPQGREEFLQRGKHRYA